MRRCLECDIYQCKHCLTQCPGCYQYGCDDGACLVSCVSCQRSVCRACISRCGQCDEIRCHGCGTKCDVCGAHLCSVCTNGCPWCTNWGCKGCMQDCQRNDLRQKPQLSKRSRQLQRSGEELEWALEDSDSED
jgi:hypothetical protein